MNGLMPLTQEWVPYKRANLVSFLPLTLTLFFHQGWLLKYSDAEGKPWTDANSLILDFPVSETMRKKFLTSLRLESVWLKW